MPHLSPHEAKAHCRLRRQRGQAAYTLTMEGASVLMLEAGRNYDPTLESAMLQINRQAPLRGVATPDRQREFYDASPNRRPCDCCTSACQPTRRIREAARDVRFNQRPGDVRRTDRKNSSDRMTFT